MDYLSYPFHPDSFHLMVLFAATCGIVAVPAILGLVAVLLERE